MKKYDLLDGSMEFDINNLIALCRIFDKYEEFRFHVKVFFDKDLKKKISDIENLSLGKKIFIKEEVKVFYKYNKEIFDIFNKYDVIISNIIDDMFNQDKFGKMYEYLKRNKNNLDNILDLLIKIKDLGFKEIYFDENKNFDKNIYDFKLGYYSENVFFVDGDVKVLPGRNGNGIRYNTNGANYLMCLNWSFDKFVSYDKYIILNNLIFDKNNLPEKIDKENIIKPLQDLKEKNKEVDQFISNSVYLNNSLEAMSEIITRIDEIVEKIGETDNKEKALAIISKTRDSVKEMNKFLSQYESQGKRKHAVKKNLLEEEKTKYKTYLRDSAIDLC